MHENTFYGIAEEWCWFIFYALRNVVSFVQFKKRKKYPWRSVAFS